LVSVLGATSNHISLKFRCLDNKKQPNIGCLPDTQLPYYTLSWGIGIKMAQRMAFWVVWPMVPMFLKIYIIMFVMQLYASRNVHFLYIIMFFGFLVRRATTSHALRKLYHLRLD
jgi:hypothetical protein